MNIVENGGLRQELLGFLGSAIQVGSCVSRDEGKVGRNTDNCCGTERVTTSSVARGRQVEAVFSMVL